MRMRWRLGLVAIIAAVVIGGFVPHGTLPGTEKSAAELVQVAEAPLSVPLHCLDATCGKGSPTSPAPTPTVTLAAVVAAATGAAAMGNARRRRRRQTALLPVGATMTLDRPPQFS